MRKWRRSREWQISVATIFGLVGAAGVLMGCTSMETQAGEPRGDKAYLTGSRIPVRDGGTSNSVRSVNNRDAADAIDERSRIYIPPKGGPQ